MCRVFARAAISNPRIPHRAGGGRPRRGARRLLFVAGSRGALGRQHAAPVPDRDRGRSPGVSREFIGFNRARHAVLEAAIYATRLHLLPRAFIDSELARLQVIVDKTAGPREIEAMVMLTDYVRRITGAPRALHDRSAGGVCRGVGASALRRARSSRRPRSMVRRHRRGGARPDVAGVGHAGRRAGVGGRRMPSAPPSSRGASPVITGSRVGPAARASRVAAACRARVGDAARAGRRAGARRSCTASSRTRRQLARAVGRGAALRDRHLDVRRRRACRRRRPATRRRDDCGPLLARLPFPASWRCVVAVPDSAPG